MRIAKEDEANGRKRSDNKMDGRKIGTQRE